MSTTPAFSPMPTSSFSRISSVVFSPQSLKWTLLDLYEQCSLHMTEYIASSAIGGRRPRGGRRRGGVRRERAGRSGCRSCGGCGLEGLADDRGEEAATEEARAIARRDRVLGGGHEPHDVAALVRDAGDVPVGAVRVA